MNSSVPATSDPSTVQGASRAALDAKPPPPPKPTPPPKDTDFGYQLFKDAKLVHPGYNSNTAVQASTDGTNATYGGIYLTLPKKVTLNQLSALSLDVQLVSGPSCAVGSPRFSIEIKNGKNSGVIFVNIPCTAVGTWSNTGNLVTNPAPVYVFAPCSATGNNGETFAQAEIDCGNYEITSLFPIVDSSNGAEVVLFDNIAIAIGSDSETYTFEPGHPDNGFTDGDSN